MAFFHGKDLPLITQKTIYQQIFAHELKEFLFAHESHEWARIKKGLIQSEKDLTNHLYFLI